MIFTQQTLANIDIPIQGASDRGSTDQVETPLQSRWIIRAASRKMLSKFDSDRNGDTRDETILNSITNNELNDSLLEQVAQNKPDAMSLCIQAYGSLIWNLVKRRIPTHSLAEDIVQEIFIELWKVAHRYDPSKGNEVTFIATIARRRIIDWARRQATHITMVELPEHFDQISDTSSNDDHSSQDYDQIASIVQSLPEPTRKLFELQYDHGMTQEEIAQKSEMPLGTVKSMLRRGLLDIRARLSRFNSSTITSSNR